MTAQHYQIATRLLSTLDQYPDANELVIRLAQIHALLALVEQTEAATNLLSRLEDSIDNLTTKVHYISDLMNPY